MQAATQSPATKDLVIEVILREARKDAGVWTELYKLGWDKLILIERQWRNVEGWQSLYPNWLWIYKNLRRALHHTPEYKDFRLTILDRDGCCVKCDATSKLEVHHRKSWFRYIDLRRDAGNCETLCKKCHKEEPSSVAQESFRC